MKNQLSTKMRDLFFIAFIALFTFNSSLAQSQSEERKEKITMDGQIVTALITETDTFIVADLEDVTVSSLRFYENKEEYRRYLMYRRYAAKVYPYANDAIKIFREVDYATKTMKKRKRKRHIRKLGKRLKKEFKKPLKKLTKTQGLILIKMIEKELDTPFYDLVKGLRGKLSAMYWNQLGKFNGYRLKEGYIVGQDPILDAVLNDFNISHQVLEAKTAE